MQSKRIREAAAEGACLIDYVDEVKVSRVLRTMPPAEALEDAAELFSVVSDPTRLRILIGLSKAELCVCDLAKVAGRSMTATSHQLQILRRLRVVTFRMEGKLAYYKLTSELVRQLIEQGVARRGRPSRKETAA
ncbi:MAG TPA: metalloregulator ArsR/SmtB family transcription factor [Polyangia bacterium]